MTNVPPVLRILLSWIGEGVVGGFAFAFINSVPSSPLRDAVLVLVWPIAILAGTVLAHRWLGIPEATPTPTSDERDALLTELQREKARDQRHRLASALRDMADETEGMRSDVETSTGMARGNNSATTWALADQWDTKVRRVLARDAAEDPTLLRDFAAPVEPMAVSDPEWRVNLARFLAIKTTRLRDVADRLDMMA